LCFICATNGQFRLIAVSCLCWISLSSKKDIIY
jgi:hypothetical protein